jgi:hypothetical protein
MKAVMFGSGGEGSKESDELKEDGDLVVGDRARNQFISPTQPCPKSFRSKHGTMCHVKRWRGALAEAQSWPASRRIYQRATQAHFSPILDELWGVGTRCSKVQSLDETDSSAPNPPWRVS